MQTPEKALLLTVLVLPGLGHWILKKHMLALVLLSASLFSGYLIIDSTIQTADKIVQQMQVNSVIPDLENLTALVESAYAEEKNNRPDTAVFILIACWLIGALDVYRIKRKLSNIQK